MKKLRTLTKWVAIFSALTLFSTQSLAALGLFNSGSKAYAHAISEDNELRKGRHFIVIDWDEFKSRHRNKHSWWKPKPHHKKAVCMVSQPQMDTLRAEFNASVDEVEVRGETKMVAKVQKERGVNKSRLYSALGIEQHPRFCKILKEGRNFLFFLLPGVS